MITKDSWNECKKHIPTNRRLLAVFDAGDNRRITQVVIVRPDNTLEFPDALCGSGSIDDIVYWQEIEVPYERQMAIARLQEVIRKERSKFIDQYGFLTGEETQTLKNTIEYN